MAPGSRLDNLHAMRLRRGRRGDAARLLVLALVALGCLALTADYHAVARYFHGDEAVYYTMAQSLAHDGDIEYERGDLERVFERFNQGPQGIVLKGRHVGDGERVYYAKPFLYSALVAPLVRWLETNGALLAGVLLLLGCVALAALWLERAGFRAPLLTAAVLFGASAAYLYSLWLQPELLNMALVLLAYFVWRWPQEAGRKLWPSTLCLALLGAVTFSKIPTGVLAGPILGTLLLRRRLGALLLGGAAFAGVAAALFGLNWWATGEWNYQGGERSIFYFARRFPYQQPGGDPFFRTPPAAAQAPAGRQASQSSDPPAEPPGTARAPAETSSDPAGFREASPDVSGDPAGFREASPDVSGDPAGLVEVSGDPLRPRPESEPASAEPAKKARGEGWSFARAWEIYRIEPSMLRGNLGSFWVGRYSGHLLYFPLLVLLLVPSLLRRPGLEDALIWLCTAGAMLCFLVLAQDNYFGGSGTVGNRYFSMMLPPLLFTLRPAPAWWHRGALIASVAIAGQLVLYPFMTLFHSGDHAARAPFRWAPVELSLINSVSIPNRNFFKLPFDDGRVLAYLPDAGTYGWEDPGRFFWTRGDGRADVVLRIPFEPLERVLAVFEAGSAEVTLDLDGVASFRELRIPAGGRAAVPLRFGEHYRHSSFHGGVSYLYPLHLRTRGGFVPAADGAVEDTRYLGVRVRFMAEPLELAAAYVAEARFDEAREVLLDVQRLRARVAAALRSVEGQATREAAAGPGGRQRQATLEAEAGPGGAERPGVRELAAAMRNAEGQGGREAVEVLRGVEQQGSREAELWLHTHEALGHPAAAVEAGERALALGASSPDVLAAVGVNALRAGQSLRALHAARELARLRPDAWWPRLLAARAAAAAGSLRLARHEAEAAARLAPGQIGPRLLLAGLDSGHAPGRPERAALAGTPLALDVDLAGVLKLESAALHPAGDVLRVRLLARTLGRPQRPLRLFAHVLDAAAHEPPPLLLALGRDLVRAARGQRPAGSLALDDGPVPPRLWTDGEFLTLELEIGPLPASARGARAAWLAIGLIDETRHERLPVRSASTPVWRGRALVPLAAR